MKLVTFSVATPIGRRYRLGAYLDGTTDARIVDLHSAYADCLSAGGRETRPAEAAAFELPPDMLGWLDGGPRAFEAATHALAHARQRCVEKQPVLGYDEAQLIFDRAQIRLHAPLPRPRSYRSFSIWESHMLKAYGKPGGASGQLRRNPDWYRYPVYYKGNPASIAGPEDPLPFPYYTEQLDAEFELGIVLGKQGRNLTVEQAKACIAGYTILVDSSGRGLRNREFLGPCKDKDFHTALGPCLVTADEFDFVAGAPVRLAVDGQTWWAGHSGDRLGWSPEMLVAYVSDNETVYPGDLFGSGTIGDSCSTDTGHWVQPGQTLRFEVQGIGALELPVVRGEQVVSHVRDGLSCLIDPNT